jgi:hypothetical protein
MADIVIPIEREPGAATVAIASESPGITIVLILRARHDHHAVASVLIEKLEALHDPRVEATAHVLGDLAHDVLSIA